jgi:histidine kinase/DNA gyrase B/HSP90-like ATPase
MTTSRRNKRPAEAQEVRDPNLIDGEPTKDLVIHSLIKDIPLGRAIIDLVDNSIDGARRVRGSGNYKGLWIHIKVDEHGFQIKDNCGGIPVPIARYYAFRFGREGQLPNEVPHSVGQFGVGMKRALFKIGEVFKITSTTTNSRFVVDIDVNKWKNKKSWDFEFIHFAENSRFEQSTCGTDIVVSRLHNEVAREFALENFRTRLQMEIEDAHRNNIAKGIVIKLNRAKLKHKPTVIKYGATIQPAYKKLEKKPKDKKPITIKIYAGLGEYSLREAGWYVFCNDRMILGADRDTTTGWGPKGTRIPVFHPQFANFRGYVYFDSDDPRLLPWNTTKTSVDSDSDLFKSVREEMVISMRPVIDFLNDVRQEQKTIGRDGPLQTTINKTKSMDVSKISRFGPFTYPDSKDFKRSPSHILIRYEKPARKVERAKKKLGARTPKEVGEKTFDYFYEQECEE